MMAHGHMPELMGYVLVLTEPAARRGHRDDSPTPIVKE